MHFASKLYYSGAMATEFYFSVRIWLGQEYKSIFNRIALKPPLAKSSELPTVISYFAIFGLFWPIFAFFICINPLRRKAKANK